MAVKVKICGIKDQRNLDAAIAAGVDYIGFVFVEASPRFIAPSLATDLCRQAKSYANQGIKQGRVGLFVNPQDDLLESVLTKSDIDIIQLHGEETAERIVAIKQKFNLPILKAFAIAEASDIQKALGLEPFVDMLLLDAKAPKSAVMPGGNGLNFDWSILKKAQASQKFFQKPWFLAGGLNPSNIETAIEQTNALYVDCSSGVESQVGLKNPELIRQFIRLAKK